MNLVLGSADYVGNALACKQEKLKVIDSQYVWMAKIIQQEYTRYKNMTPGDKTMWDNKLSVVVKKTAPPAMESNQQKRGEKQLSAHTLATWVFFFGRQAHQIDGTHPLLARRRHHWLRGTSMRMLATSAV
jgi:hypothetical protein